jgi:lipoprotein-anchoring transpeptidase ErfK/SrfK
MKRYLGSFVAAAVVLAVTTFGAGAASIVARIDVAAQTMTVSQYGKVIHEWPVSTARAGYITPRGEYRPYRMHRMWYSRTYDNAPMPFAVFYDRGWAVHGTSAVRRLGTPASHGCVRLATPNAEIFYYLVRESGAGNTRIFVVDGGEQIASSDVVSELRR